ncbi:hypothetical protein IQ07DRAFT_615692 [Pyrenochaeta sp. DS3sAY3a]|nr:hypothetical protein IQ07DRAFT_615692 [Pyrenochaeta sp. DS3sAY3a]
MNFSAVLNPAQTEAFSDADRGHGTVATSFEELSANQGANGEEGVFEKSLRLKNTLDVCEERARSQPSWRILALLLNCEHKLWSLNAATPLRHNPFLTHWVEALQRLDKDNIDEKKKAKATNSARDAITTDEISKVRAEWIKRLLSSKHADTFLPSTARELHQAVFKFGEQVSFDIHPYIEMLEEEGIYDKPEVPRVSTGKQSKEQPANNASAQWKKDMLQRLKEDPDVVVQELTHLPLELPYLDFLTTLLTEHTLESHSIDPAPVINSYIQHALRLTEHMGEPPTNLAMDGSTGSPENHGPVRQYGKEAQSRAVRLLLLFIKSVIRKELLGLEVLYFEIQEICVRYVWIKEVRDFRSWIEEGIGDERAG